MRSSQRPIQQRLAAYSRRRRLMLASSPTPTPNAPINEDPVLDPRTLEMIHSLANYLNDHRGGVESLVKVAAQIVQHQSSSVALLADLSTADAFLPASRWPQESGDPQKVSVSASQAHATATSLEVAESLPQAGKSCGHSPGINRIRGWLQTEPSRTWMFVGDEVTAWMRYHSQPGYAEMFRHRLRWELRRFSDVVVNAGIQHATLNDIQKITRQGMSQCQPDVVFVMPGKNDLPALRHPRLYSDQLVSVAEMIRAKGAEPVFQTPPVPHNLAQKGHSLPLAQLADLIREISVIYEIPLIDHAEFWMDQASCSDWYDSESELLNATGQAALAMQFFSELDLFDRNSPLCARLQMI